MWGLLKFGESLDVFFQNDLGITYATEMNDIYLLQGSVKDLNHRGEAIPGPHPNIVSQYVEWSHEDLH